jgi:hypothetical protein
MMEYKKHVFIAAATGWAISVLIHILCLVGYVPVAKVGAIWVIHIATLLTFGYATWYTHKQRELNDNDDPKPGIVTLFKKYFKGLPIWVGVLGVFCFYYAPVNFLLCMMEMPGNPDIINGQYVIQNHGKVVQTLTQDGYNLALLRELRMFSGNWIAFFSITIMLLYPRVGEGGAPPIKSEGPG